MRLLSTLFLLTSFSSLILGAAIEASDKTFNGLINTPEKWTFVKFYAQWCGHCKNLAPVWDELSDLFSRLKAVQFVSIDADQYSRVGRKYQIQGYPTLKAFGPNGEVKEYQGPRDIDLLKGFVEATAGIRAAVSGRDYVVHADDSSLFPAISGEHAFIAITASWCGYCKRLHPDWTALANVFREDSEVVIADVVALDVSLEHIKKLFEVQSFPTIVYVRPDDETGEKFEKYEGGRSLEDLVAWVNSYSHVDRTSKGSLGENAGLLSDIDSLIAELFVLKGTSQAKRLEEIIAAVQAKPESYSKNYYLKMLAKVKLGELAFFSKELERLKRLALKPENVAQKVHDKVVKRINILRVFDGISVRDEL